MPKDTIRAILIHLPEQLRDKFVKESVHLTVKTGQRVSVAALIRDVLSDYYGRANTN